ncbi:M23 family metallopeptidase [Streptomyces uncialis]|uniref:M23 family metallopeptidase n=1 Tax=Streptomyces uncialis TaxID=1048205 RepID=UPI0033E46AD6
MPTRTSTSARTHKAHKALTVAYHLGWLLLAALIVGSFVVERLDEPPFPLLWPVLGAGVLVLMLLVRLTGPSRGAAPRTEPIEVAPPVTGRWLAVNSPADKVPSHGTHGYGQTYAIDIVAEPEPRRIAGRPTNPQRPGFAWFWPPVRRPEAYPAFGAPVLAVADATVVQASGTQRDHLSRTSPLPLLYLMLLEGMARAMVGPHRVTGNHLVLDLGDGTYAMYAHLKKGSLKVRAGDRVTEGTVLAECGNSGNSTEPHLHFQLMDTPDLETARGLPFRWRGVGLPAGGETFTAPERTGDSGRSTGSGAASGVTRPG